MTKNILFSALILLLTTACQESLEERCAREAKDYTEKHCPITLDAYTILDSMTFDKQSHTISYIYSLQGMLDDSALIQRNTPREQLLMKVKNSQDLQLYKDAGYNFRYVYFSTKEKGTQLFEATFRQSDYQ